MGTPASGHAVRFESLSRAFDVQRETAADVLSGPDSRWARHLGETW